MRKIIIELATDNHNEISHVIAKMIESTEAGFCIERWSFSADNVWLETEVTDADDLDSLVIDFEHYLTNNEIPYHNVYLEKEDEN